MRHRTFAGVLIAAITVLTVSARAMPTVIIHVDADAASGGDGSGRRPFNDLSLAIERAHAVTGPVIVQVAPGDYPIASTLVIDRSIDLHGSTELTGGADGWPTGEYASNTATRIFASDPALATLVLVGSGHDTVPDVRIRGFIFESTPIGISLLMNRVQGYWIAGNVFRAPALFALQSVASSGRVSGNYFTDVGTGAILAGGYPESPANVTFDGNRIVHSNTGGLLLDGASTNLPELGDELHAVIRDNDLSENFTGQGFGLRVFILRRDLGVPGDSQADASVYAVIQRNRIVGDRIGVVVDAGFPYRTADGVCDTRVYSGTIGLQFAGNLVLNNVLTPALVTFTRSTAALTPSSSPLWQYLHGATFTIDDRDAIFASAWIDHPSADPQLGPCAADSAHELLNNVLIYNGRALPNGRNF